jgi:hypothetical protein
MKLIAKRYSIRMIDWVKRIAMLSKHFVLLNLRIGLHLFEAVAVYYSDILVFE